MKEFKIVGFINSSEIWSTLNLGSSTAGDGTLASYGIVSSSAFADNSNTLARIRYDRLKKISPFSDVYSSKINHYQDELDKLLEDNGQERLRELKKKPQEKVNQSKQALTVAKEQLQEQTRALTSASPDQQQLVQRSLAQARHAKPLLKKSNKSKRLKPKLMLCLNQLTLLLRAPQCWAEKAIRFTLPMLTVWEIWAISSLSCSTLLPPWLLLQR